MKSANSIKSKKEVISEGIKYLLKTQKKDGSWDGPLSSRIRETYLVFKLSKDLKWKSLNKQAENWIGSNLDNHGDSELEIALNKAFISLFKKEKVDLTNEKLYDPVIARKALMIYILAIINDLEVIVPEKFKKLEVVYVYLDNYLKANKTNIKEWALVEMLAFQLVIANKLGLETSKIASEIKTFKKNNSWFKNPATTAMSLIALNHAGYLDQEHIKVDDFFHETWLADGGWTYSAIPLWDRGLSLETLSLYKHKDKPIQASLEKALKYIEKNQNEDGGWGFDANLESETDTSSIILYSLRHHKKRMKKVIDRSIEYFHELQFENSEHAGLWPVWRKTELPSAEVVAHIVSALKQFKSASHIDLNPAISWLTNKIKDSSWSADWGRSLPYSINSMLNHIKFEKHKKELVKYLVENQNKKGGWGVNELDSDNPSATANAIIALKQARKTSKVKAAIEKGEKYLISTQLKNGTWPRVREVIGPRPFAYADDCSTHNFAMQALLS